MADMEYMEHMNYLDGMEAVSPDIMNRVLSLAGSY